MAKGPYWCVCTRVLVWRKVSTGVCVHTCVGMPKGLQHFPRPPLSNLDCCYLFGIQTAHYHMKCRVQCACSFARSSSINGMIWVRGNPTDYDAWADATGDSGWEYQHFGKYMTRSEDASLTRPDLDPNNRDNHSPSQQGWASAVRDYSTEAPRGFKGPMKLTHGGFVHPLCEAFVDAGVESGVGLCRTEDFNQGSNTSGVGTSPPRQTAARYTATFLFMEVNVHHRHHACSAHLTRNF